MQIIPSLALVWGVGFAAGSGPARLQSTRYLGTAPSPDRPTWPHLPEAFPGPVLDVALGAGSSLWLLGSDGSAWCCVNASNLMGATCGRSDFQLAEGAARVVAGGVEDASVVGLASGASFALAKQVGGCGVADVNVASVALGVVADLCVDDATSSLWLGGATGSLWCLPSSPGAAPVVEEASFMDGTGITALAVGYGAGGEQLLAVATELALYHSFSDPNKASGRGWRHDWLQVPWCLSGVHSSHAAYAAGAPVAAHLAPNNRAGRPCRALLDVPRGVNLDWTGFGGVRKQPTLQSYCIKENPFMSNTESP